MRSLTVEQSFGQFVAEPTADRLRRIRKLILSRPDYQPYSPLWHQLDFLLQEDRYSEVHELASEFESWAHLSPRWHFWMGVAANAMGHPAEASNHGTALKACLKGMLATGQGTEEEPFLVTYATDAQDILRGLGETAVHQELVFCGDRCFDVLTTESGLEFWFDASDLIAHAGLLEAEVPQADPKNADLCQGHALVRAEITKTGKKGRRPASSTKRAGNSQTK